MVYSIDTNVLIDYMNVGHYDHKKAIRVIHKNEDIFLSFFMIKESITVYNRILEETLEKVIKIIKKKRKLTEPLLKTIDDYDDKGYFYNLIFKKYLALNDKNIGSLLQIMSSENLNRKKIINIIRFKRNIIFTHDRNNYNENYSKYFHDCLFNDGTDKKIICDVFTFAYSRKHKIKFFSFDKDFQNDLSKVKLPKYRNRSAYVEFILLATY